MEADAARNHGTRAAPSDAGRGTIMNTTIARMGRRLRLGVVGGGPGSFIGTVHRAAARLDDHYEIVAAVMSRNPERARAAARAIGIPEERAYVDHGELLAREAERADGIDVLAIMTPNDTHYPIARDALASGLDVICDKPLATNLEDALDLVRRVAESGLVFCLTHNYTGYPMVRHARAMVQSGELGPIRQVHVEYIQGNLAAPTEADRDPAANWRFVGRAVRRIAGARRHRHPCPPSRELHHRARADRGRGRARQRRAGAAGARLCATCCCASRAARAARCG